MFGMLKHADTEKLHKTSPSRKIFRRPKLLHCTVLHILFARICNWSKSDYDMNQVRYVGCGTNNDKRVNSQGFVFLRVSGAGMFRPRPLQVQIQTWIIVALWSSRPGREKDRRSRNLTLRVHNLLKNRSRRLFRKRTDVTVAKMLSAKYYGLALKKHKEH